MVMLDVQPAPRVDRRQHETPGSLDKPGVSCGLHGGSRWYCAWTLQQRERRAADLIRDAGFESYLPMHVERTACWHKLIVPLFPRYVFVRFDRDRDPWGKIIAVRAVCGLIQHGLGLPTPLPDIAILDLQARTSVRGVVDDPGERAWKSVGDDYSPIWAPMAGLDAGARSRLLVRLFGLAAMRRIEENAAA
jgi:transcriptional antiterminator RfaH